MANDESPDKTQLLMQKRDQMLRKIEGALRKSFERKQDQIKSNLEQIMVLEKQLSDAK